MFSSVSSPLCRRRFLPDFRVFLSCSRGVDLPGVRIDVDGIEYHVLVVGLKAGQPLSPPPARALDGQQFAVGDAHFVTLGLLQGLESCALGRLLVDGQRGQVVWVFLSTDKELGDSAGCVDLNVQAHGHQGAVTVAPPPAHDPSELGSVPYGVDTRLGST
ncbi:hypothetical protein ACWD6P_09130 [Streptomyces sp. NPDC002446]